MLFPFFKVYSNFSKSLKVFFQTGHENLNQIFFQSDLKDVKTKFSRLFKNDQQNANGKLKFN